MPFYNFGLEGYIPYGLYILAILVLLLSMFRRSVFGIYFLVPLLPLQTIRYRLNDLPLGTRVVYIILIAVGIGVLREGRTLLPKTAWSRVLAAYISFTLVSLWMGASYLNYPAPLPGDQRFDDWMAYMTMPAIFFMVVASVRNAREMKIVFALMCFSILLLDKSFWNSIAGRDFSTYSEDLRATLSAGGSMGYAGVNGLAAFEAQATAFLLAISFFEKRFWWRICHLALAFYSALCLMYSLSRGAYVALLAAWVFLGVVKQRTLLVLLTAFALVWTTVVPNAVVMRVQMTNQDGQLDHSSELRIQLWEDAMQLIRANPVTGTGFNTYAYMHRVLSYEDTHNYYLKVLVETGVIGLLLFVSLLAKSIHRGWVLFRRASDPFFRGLGLGLMGWVIATAVAIAFGDRWSYLQIQGFFWVLAGLVARGWALHEQDAERRETQLEPVSVLDPAVPLAAIS